MRKITLRKKTWLAASVLALGMATTASAGSILSLMKTGPNKASDEDREYLVDNNLGAMGDWDGNPLTPDTIAVKGQIDVGDSLRGLVSINTLNSGSANVGGSTGNNEWTAVFQAQVKTKVDFGGGLIQYTFGPDASFEAIYGAGALAAMFEDNPDVALDFDDPTAPVTHDDGTPLVRTVPPSSADVSTGLNVSEEAFIATGADGLHFWTLGFTGAGGTANLLNGEGWSATAIGFGDNVLNAFNFTSGASGVSFNAGLSLLYIDPLIDTVLDVNKVTPVPFGAGKADFAFTGNAKGVADLDTAFDVSSDYTLSWNATVVPEPGTMILLGSGLLGLAGLGRKRGKKS